MSRWLALLLLCISMPTVLLSQSKGKASHSVVQIRCATPDGDMKATGFIWPEPGYVVTALHAIAGCAPGKGLVYSESAKKETLIATYLAADLEGDLALLKLEDDLGLPALMISDMQPALTDAHIVWGYPLAAEQMIGLRIEFALGLDAGATTLGRAFSSADLAKLFRNQGYPKRNTQILRVTTTIQPGHSGAPILDPKGRVVAIADGGLLGGWRGINWSVPAGVYLPDLPNSTDPFPSTISEQANLFSAMTVRDPITVALGQTTPKDRTDQDGPAHAGSVPFPVALDAYGIAEDEDLSWIIDDLTDILPTQKSRDLLMLTGLLPAGADQPIFVPERVKFTYDPAFGSIEALSTDGSVRQVTVSYEGDDFEDALAKGSALLVDKLTALGIDARTVTVPENEIDRQLEFVNYVAPFGKTDSPLATNFTVQVNGPHFSGRAIHRTKTTKDMTDTDYIDYLMMDFATFDLNSLAPLENEIWDRLDPDDLQIEQNAQEPSALTLVRRIPLANVALEFVEAQDFEWKESLVGLKEQLDDPGDFDALAFDIYEDRLTGATIAVPSGLPLAWDPALGAVKTSIGDGSVELAIAVERTADLATAADRKIAKFVEQISTHAAWTDQKPTDCKLVEVPDDDLATCWGYFEGTDRTTDEFADLYLALDVRNNVLLGTSVYIVGKEEDLTKQEAITYRMMLIAAEHLTDFAAK